MVCSREGAEALPLAGVNGVPVREECSDGKLPFIAPGAAWELGGKRPPRTRGVAPDAQPLSGHYADTQAATNRRGRPNASAA
mmetsp:Transcript_48798/g.136589  ORF Transcript_48798/g.136589 Transcript_48798/m.136589 type:complete len:82 (+) Transcript_48798:296-541(+)